MVCVTFFILYSIQVEVLTYYVEEGGGWPPPRRCIVAYAVWFRRLLTKCIHYSYSSVIIADNRNDLTDTVIVVDASWNTVHMIGYYLYTISQIFVRMLESREYQSLLSHQKYWHQHKLKYDRRHSGSSTLHRTSIRSAVLYTCTFCIRCHLKSVGWLAVRAR